MFEKVIVIDARAHLIGRLASIVAKQLLGGQRVVVVRCEALEISGSKWRNQIKLNQRRNKKTNSNPERGPFSIRAPAAILLRMVRGMVPHKTQRGTAALNRFKAYEGIPAPYDKMKRQVIPEAMRVLRLKTTMKYTVIGDLASNNGWKHADFIKTIEAKRKVKSHEFYEKKKAERALLKQATAEADIPADVAATLASYGH